MLTTYILKLKNNFSGLSQTEIKNLCEEVWNTAIIKISEVASEREVTLEGEIHYCNYPNDHNPHVVLNHN